MGIIINVCTLRFAHPTYIYNNTTSILLGFYGFVPCSVLGPSQILSLSPLGSILIPCSLFFSVVVVAPPSFFVVAVAVVPPSSPSSLSFDTGSAGSAGSVDFGILNH